MTSIPPHLAWDTFSTQFKNLTQPVQCHGPLIDCFIDRQQNQLREVLPLLAKTWFLPQSHDLRLGKFTIKNEFSGMKNGDANEFGRQ
jgi:hypothetical protein